MLLVCVSSDRIGFHLNFMRQFLKTVECMREEMLGHEIPFVQNGFQMVDKWLEII